MKSKKTSSETCIKDYIAARGRRSRAVWIPVLAAVLLIAVFVVDTIRCSTDFVVTKYVIRTEKVTGRVDIVMISDLHESEFGEGNERLIAAVREIKPDIILCAGDMITRTVADEDLHIGLDFMAEMAKIAPTYMSLGNHEAAYIEQHGDGILNALRESGVRVLELEYEDVRAFGQDLRIGGISDYCFRYSQTDEEYHASEKYAFFTDLCDTDSYKILLSHRPTAYRLDDEIEYYEDWDIDLVLAGHTHGGLVRLPLVGSLYLPQQGLFPELDKGLKDVGKADMLIGAGLGSERFLLRFNDPCELIHIRLMPAA